MDRYYADLAMAGSEFTCVGCDDPVVARVWKLVEPVCESDGMGLVFVEFHRESSGRVLRLYIECLESGRGVTIEDCARISRQVSGLLDLYMEDIEDYTLEVSSAGLERPLAKEKDFVRFAGKTARIRTVEPVSGRRNFKGRLLGVSDGNVGVLIDGREFVIPCVKIARAKLVNEDGVKQ